MTASKEKIKIFISYGRTESEIFKKIVAYLESKGYEVWFDQTKIKGTDDWRENIIKGIRESQTVIAGLSEHFLRKGGVCSEEMGIALAIKSNRIYTIYLEKKEELGKIPSSLTRRQWVDLSDWEKYIENDKDFEAWFEKEFQPIIDNIESKENKEFSGQINTIRHALRIPEIGSTKADSYLIKKYTPRDNLDEKVNEWLEDENGKKIGVVYGQPATGKSHYAAEKCHTDYHVSASFFCEYNKENFSTSKNLIRELAFQLACQIPDYRTALLHQLESIAVPKKKINQMGLEENVDDGQIHIREDYTEAEEFDYLIVRPLSICIDGDMENQMILIDALDEAGKVERNKLLDIIKNHLIRLPRWMKILILTRPELDITSKLKDAHEIKLGTEENKKDIKDYLEKTFEKESYPNKKEIIETIIEKSRGTFLYAELVSKEILAKAMDIEKLDKLPTGLESYFLNWFSRIYPIEKIDEAYKEKDRKAIAMILASPRPLPTEEIRNLLGWDYSQTSDFVKKIEIYLSKKDDIEGKETIEIAHKYMADWLISDLAGDYKVYKEDGLAYIYKGIEELYMLDKDLESMTRYEKINLIDALKNQRGKGALKDFLANDIVKDKLFDFVYDETVDFRVESAAKLYEDMLDTYKGDEDNIKYYSLCVNGYGKILKEVGKEKEFIKIHKELIKKLEDILSRKDDMSYKSLLSMSYNNLGSFYRSIQSYKDSEIYLKKTIDLNERLKKNRNSLDNILDLAKTYNNIGALYESMKKYKESESYHKKAVALYEEIIENRNSSDDISDLARSYGNLGALYNSMHRHEEAEKYLKKSMYLRENLKKTCDSISNREELAASYTNLGSLYESMQRYEESEIYHKKAINILKDLKEIHKSLSDMSSLARVYINIGVLYTFLHRYDEAENYYRQALEIYIDLKESHRSFSYLPDLAVLYGYLGNLFSLKRRYDQAERYYKKSIALSEQLRESSDYSYDKLINLANSYSGMGDLYNSIEKYDKAEEYLKKSISIGEDIYKNIKIYIINEIIANSSNVLSNIFFRKNKLDQAKTYLNKSIKHTKILAKEDKDLKNMTLLAANYYFLGTLYADSNEKKTEKYMLESIRILEDLYAKSPDGRIFKKLIMICDDLAFYYESRGKHKKAENCRKKLKKLTGPKNPQADFNILDLSNLKDLL